MTPDKTDSYQCIVLFFSKASGPQAWLGFSDIFKHCTVITFDGKNHIATEFNGEGIVNRILNIPDNTLRLISRLKMIDDIEVIYSLYVRHRCQFKWRPFWSRSCNELARYVGGLDIGYTFNPVHLHNKIRKYNGERNYCIDYYWRKSDG